MNNLFVVFAFLSVGCFAHAKPVKETASQNDTAFTAAKKASEFIEKVDAQEALLAAAELREAQAKIEAAQAIAEIKKLVWARVKAKLAASYGIDPDAGEGWDEQPDGTLKIRRATKQPMQSKK